MAVADKAGPDQRAMLEALRDDLAKAFDNAPDTVKPQIAAQLRATLADLRAMPGPPVELPKGVVSVEDAKQRRAARQSAAEAPPVAKAGGRKRG